MLAVVCFWWQGDRWKNKDEGAKYVKVLRNSVRRNLCCDYKKQGPIPYEFICFSNDLDGEEIGVDVRPFKMPVNKGVLPRMYMFSGEAGLVDRPVLALDLDVIITGPLHELATFETQFCSRSKFAPGQQWKLDGDVTKFYASKENTDRFWKPLLDNPAHVLDVSQGKERYWFRHVVGEDGGDRWDRQFPGAVISYKRHVHRTGMLPRGAKIVSCHGRPRPHQILNKHRWARDNWR